MPDYVKTMHPKDVSDLITFVAKDMDWAYDASLNARPTMAGLQAEGVAYLWNLLTEHRLALLADEVGMGKTFQALGVASLLWRDKPDAKILIMAPNQVICQHWAREFETFTKEHYKKADDCVKKLSDDLPKPLVAQHYRLRSLAEAIEGRAERPRHGQLYITTIHSLSGLTSNGDPKADKRYEARREAEAIRKKILNGLGEEGFDLVIIDEAHYFRNKNGSSQRVAAAKAFFGTPEDSIGQRTLLLTATPSHTHLEDVSNILSYFIPMDEKELAAPVDGLMIKYGLRRFRILAGSGDQIYTKHQYRSEFAISCEFGDLPNAEMFFALYQRRLVHELNIRNEKRKVLYGYLEGFESLGSNKKNSESDHAEDEHSKDFNSALDTALLGEMSDKYRELFISAPEHPKYGKVVSECASEVLFGGANRAPLHEDKHLVFVRRIPSVHELTKRVNEQYDEIFAKEICAAWKIKPGDPKFDDWRKQEWSREGFDAIARDAFRGNAVENEEDSEKNDDDAEAADAAENGDPENVEKSSYLRSRIADLFKTINPGNGAEPIPATDCSRFSLNLRKSTSIHAMFMEPSSDYLIGAYEQHYEFKQGGKSRLDYTKLAHDQRMSGHGLGQESERLSHTLTDKIAKKYTKPIQTMWALVFPHLSSDEKMKLRRWSKESPEIAENFADYVKTGFLFASPVIIELYCWHTIYERNMDRTKRNTKAESRYHGFYAFAKKNIAGSLLLRYFAAALASFEQLCGKIIDHKADDYKTGWSMLRSLSNPAWYASGASSNRQRLILGFNSPFYPNTLVATSVFQEGVNLHLQCRKVHHYGIAWTPGDNEQRVGRVDRLFGKVNELLKIDDPGSVSLDINYPYLAGSFDEDQVGSFIERKFGVEEKMDRCVQGSFDKGIGMTRSDWRSFLRKPQQSVELDDPYPAHFSERVGIASYQDTTK